MEFFPDGDEAAEMPQLHRGIVAMRCRNTYRTSVGPRAAPRTLAPRSTVLEADDRLIQDFKVLGFLVSREPGLEALAVFPPAGKLEVAVIDRPEILNATSTYHRGRRR